MSDEIVCHVVFQCRDVEAARAAMLRFKLGEEFVPGATPIELGRYDCPDERNGCGCDCDGCTYCEKKE